MTNQEIEQLLRGFAPEGDRPARPMTEHDLDQLAALYDDPGYDEGPELPVDEQSDPDDPGLWAIWENGPIAWNAKKAASKVDRWWREHGEAR